MSVINIAATNQGGGDKTEEVEFDLSTLEGSRKTYSRIIEAYAAGSISEQKARCLGYLMSNFLPYWRLEQDLRIEEDLEKIKDHLGWA
jgi:hypothetical protein